MQAGLGVIVGIALGFGAFALLGRRIDPMNPPRRPSALSWFAIALGALALLMIVAGIWGPSLARTLGISPAAVRAVALPAALSIVLSVAAAVAAGGAFAKGERNWGVSLAMVLALAPVVFWVWFIVASLVGPA